MSVPFCQKEAQYMLANKQYPADTFNKKDGQLLLDHVLFCEVGQCTICWE